MPSVRTHHERRANLDQSLGAGCVRAPDDIVFHDKIGERRIHQKMKVRISARVLGEEIQEIPLRHEPDEAGGRRQERDVGELIRAIAEADSKRIDFLMGSAQEIS